MRRRYLNRGTTPLLCAEPPFAIVARIHDEARASVPWFRGGGADPTIARQDWLRRVSVDFHRRLAAAGIYVEGAE